MDADSHELKSNIKVHKHVAQLITANQLDEALQTITDWLSAEEGRSMPKLLQRLHLTAMENGETEIAINALQHRVLGMVNKTGAGMTARKFNDALRRLVSLSDQHRPENGARRFVAELMQRIETLPKSHNRVDGTILTRGAVIAQQARYLELDGKREAADAMLNEQLIESRTVIKEDEQSADITMRVRAMVELLVVAQHCGSQNCRGAELDNLLEKFIDRIPDSRFVEVYMERQFTKVDKHIRSSPEFSHKVLSETEIKLQQLKDTKSFGNIFAQYDRELESHRNRLKRSTATDRIN